MNTAQIRSSYRTVAKEIQLMSALFYVLAIGIGMLFNYFKFEKFNINIFDYSDVWDFLVIPFSDYRILVFTLISVIVAYGFYRFDAWWHRKYPRSYSKANFGMDKKPWFNRYLYATILFLFFWYLLIGANLYGSVVQKQINNSNSVQVCFSDNETMSGKLIGKTKDVFFLLSDEKVQIIPLGTGVKTVTLSTVLNKNQ